MENKYTKITFKAKIEPIKELNPEFSLVKVYCQGIGKNRNGTYMSRENVEKYLNTLNYCPVVGHIREYTDDDGVLHRYMGEHDRTIDWEKLEFVDMTVPYGVVVEDSFDFETVNEYGTDVEYLTAQAILWTGRYEELKECIYSDDVWFNQSIEIEISQHRPLEEDSNYIELLEWHYSALCLLGKADADSTNGHTDRDEHTEPCFISSKVIPLEFSKSEFAEIMSEMKDKLSFCLQDQSSAMEVDIDKELGGNSMATEEVKDVETVEEEVVETTDVEETVETETEETEDVAEETNETTEEVFSAEMYETLKGDYEKLMAEFAEYQADHTYANAEYEELKSFKEAKEAEERKASEDALFASFEESIGGKAEFAELKEKASEYSIDQLKKECLCIVGLYATVTSKEEKAPEKSAIKFSLESSSDETENEPYGGIMKKYLNK